MGFPGGTRGKELAGQCRKHEVWFWSQSQEDPLEEGMATHSSILAWRIPWTGETVHSITTSWHNWNNSACTRTQQLSGLKEPPVVKHSKVSYDNPKIPVTCGPDTMETSVCIQQSHKPWNRAQSPKSFPSLSFPSILKRRVWPLISLGEIKISGLCPKNLTP